MQVPKQMNNDMLEKVLDWAKRNSKHVLKQNTVKQFGELMAKLGGMDAYDAAMTLDQQGWRSDTELVLILAGKS